MQPHPHSAPHTVQVIVPSASLPLAAPCPVLTTVKARAKALKKWRKQERLRFFLSLCSSFHALGFSF
jgi:hypothetical protein